MLWPTVSPSEVTSSSPSEPLTVASTAKRYVPQAGDNPSILESANSMIQGKEGIIVVKAVSCVIVAHHPESVQTTNASNAVEGLVDYINNPR